MHPGVDIFACIFLCSLQNWRFNLLPQTFEFMLPFAHPAAIIDAKMYFYSDFLQTCA